MSFVLEKGNFHCYVRLPECMGNGELSIWNLRFAVFVGCGWFKKWPKKSSIRPKSFWEFSWVMNPMGSNPSQHHQKTNPSWLTFPCIDWWKWRDPCWMAYDIIPIYSCLAFHPLKKRQIWPGSTTHCSYGIRSVSDLFYSPFQLFLFLWVETYCWWKKSCTSW